MFFNGYQNNRIEVTLFELTGTAVIGSINYPIDNNGGIIIMLIVICQRMETILFTSGNNIAGLSIE